MVSFGFVSQVIRNNSWLNSRGLLLRFYFEDVVHGLAEIQSTATLQHRPAKLVPALRAHMRDCSFSHFFSGFGRLFAGVENPQDDKTRSQGEVECARAN